MDDYKKYLYERDADKYELIDAGDLTAQKAIREKLNCKSFKWFMEEVAFDLPQKYPMVEPPDFAYGAIQSLVDTNLCIDTLNGRHNEKIGLYSCAENRKRPQGNQFFVNSWHKDIRLKSKTTCWDVATSEQNAPVLLYECHGQQGNQYWRYDPVSKYSPIMKFPKQNYEQNMNLSSIFLFQVKKMLHQGHNNRCLDANVKTKEVYVNACDESNPNMKWEFGDYNATALANFKSFGVAEA